MKERLSPLFFNLASNAFPDVGSVGWIHIKSGNKRPGNPASLLRSLEIRHEPQINMAEKLADVIVKLRQRGKKNRPPKLYVVNMFIFLIKRTSSSENGLIT